MGRETFGKGPTAAPRLFGVLVEVAFSAEVDWDNTSLCVNVGGSVGVDADNTSLCVAMDRLVEVDLENIPPSARVEDLTVELCHFGISLLIGVGDETVKVACRFSPVRCVVGDAIGVASDNISSSNRVSIESVEAGCNDIWLSVELRDGCVVGIVTISFVVTVIPGALETDCNTISLSPNNKDGFPEVENNTSVWSAESSSVNDSPCPTNKASSYT